MQFMVLQSQLQGRLLELAEGRLGLKAKEYELHKGTIQKKWTEDIKEHKHEIDSLKAENAELRLDILSWRKKASVFRLKLASSDEDVRLLQDNRTTLQLQLSTLIEHKSALERTVAHLNGELHAAKLLANQQTSDASRQQDELAAAQSELSSLNQKLAEEEQHAASLRTERDNVLQQLSGTQLLLQTTSARVEALAADFGRSEACNRALQQQVAAMQTRLDELQQQLISTKEKLTLADNRQQIAEERARNADQAMNDWKQVAHERKGMMEEKEIQLQHTQQLELQLTDAKASVAEERLQLQLQQMKDKLDAEASRRIASEEALRHEALRWREQHSYVSAQLERLNREVVDKNAKITDLEENLKQRAVDNAMKDVGKLVSELHPVYEDSDAEEEGQGESLQHRQQHSLLAAAIAPRGRTQAPQTQSQHHHGHCDQAGADHPLEAGVEAGPSAQVTHALRDISNTRPGMEAEVAEAGWLAARNGKKVTVPIAQAPEPAGLPPARDSRGRRKADAKATVASAEDGIGVHQEAGLEQQLQQPPAQPAAAAQPDMQQAKKKQTAGPSKAEKNGPAAATAALPQAEPASQPEQPEHELDDDAAEGHGEVHAVPCSQPAAAGPCTSTIGGPSLALPLFKPRVVDPLAALNPRVMEAAAMRRSSLSMSAKQALRVVGSGFGMDKPSNKRKLLKPNPAFLPSGADVVPANMLMDSLKVPKVRRIGE